MAKFCTKCGKKLEDGEKCTCNANTTSSFDIKKSFKDILDLLKGMFTKPVDTMKSFIKEDNYLTGLIMLGINAILVIVLVLILSKILYTMFMPAASILDMFGVATEIKIPYVKIAFTTLFVLALLYASIIGLLFIISNKLLKGKTNIKKITSYVAATSSIISVVLVLSIFFGFINYKIALFIMTAGLLLKLCYMYSGLKFTTTNDENKYGYILVPTLLVSIIIVALIFTKIIF